jgi:hypothetical protein
MLRRLFAALANLSGNVQPLAESFAEANVRLRDRLALDGPADETPPGCPPPLFDDRKTVRLSPTGAACRPSW